MSRPTALVVEDSTEFEHLARRLLESEGYRVVVARTGEAGVEVARREQPELLLVDVSLPGIDGFEVCREVRRFSDAYVVMVTGRTEEVERVLGFRLGADDYVTKPYSSMELAARIGALRRRPRVPTSRVRAFGSLTIDPEAREVVVDGGPVALTRIEFDLLELLSGSPRRAFTRALLLESVWGWSSGDDHVVDVHLANLRRKLGESASTPRWIHTVRGVGYRFDPVAAAATGPDTLAHPA